MKHLANIVSLALISVFLFSCSQAPAAVDEPLALGEPAADAQQAPTVPPPPTATAVPPTETPLPPSPTPQPSPTPEPTATPEPSPTPANLLAMEEDLAAFLVGGGTDEELALAPQAEVDNGSPDVIAVADGSDLLAYFAEVEAEIALDNCRQEANTLTCEATEINRWLWELGDVQPLTYDVVAFTLDDKGHIGRLSLTLSQDSAEWLHNWIAFHGGWLGEGDEALHDSVFTSEDQLIYSAASGAQIGELYNVADARLEALLPSLESIDEAITSGSYDDALEMSGEVLAMQVPDPVRAFILTARAGTYDKLGRLEESVETYLLVLELEPEDTTALNNLCWNYSLLEQPEEALPYCEQAVALEPEASGFVDSRGLAYGMLGRYEEAIADFESVIPQWQESGDAKAIAAAAERAQWVETMKAGENPFTPEVMQHLRDTSYQTDADDTPAQSAEDAHARASQLLMEEEYEAAIAAYDEAIALDPDNPDLYMERGSAYFFSGDEEGSLRDLDQAIALGTQNGMAYFLRANHYLMQGQLDTAAADLHAALDLGLPPDFEEYAREVLAELET